MRSKIECFPCYINQAVSAVRYVTKDKKKQFALVRSAARALSRTRLGDSPADNSFLVLDALNKASRARDPFHSIKRFYNRKALAMYGELKRRVRLSTDPLKAAVKIAVAGNIIDLGILSPAKIDSKLKTVLSEKLAIFHYKEFVSSLKNNRRIFYLADNSGEIVFDRVLIEELVRYAEIIVAVNGKPALNDALMEDVRETGLDKIAKIITTGAGRIGKSPVHSSAEFRKYFNGSGMIISKGQANFELLESYNKNIFFLLQAKCGIVAGHLGVDLGAPVLVCGKRRGR